MNGIRTVGVFTSSRADYGLLTPLMRAFQSDPAFELRLLCGGSHLVDDYGMTVNEIVRDGFVIHRKFPFLNTEPRLDSASQSLARLQEQFGAYLAEDPPQLLIVMGDRFELISVVTAGLLTNTPIAHLSGGEVTLGAIDDQIRNAVTKLSHLHFPATEQYKTNLLRMGEEEWRICVSGEPGLDTILNLNLGGADEVFQELQIDPAMRLVLCTFHPETIVRSITPEFLDSLITLIAEDPTLTVLATSANFDPGGPAINEKWIELTSRFSNVKFVKNLGSRRYYAVLSAAVAIIGNSSSGIIEAQSFGVPAINVGERQAGRIANPNVIHVATDPDAVSKALRVATSAQFKSQFVGRPNLYGDGHACERILKFLKNLPARSLLVKNRPA